VGAKSSSPQSVDWKDLDSFSNLLQINIDNQ